MRTRWHLFFGVFLLQLNLAVAQSNLQQQLHRLSTLIAEAEDQNLKGKALDSLYRQKLAYLKQADQLGLYCDAAWNWQANYFEQSEKALDILHQALQGIWRKPGEKADAESLMWLYINQGYHLFQLGRVAEAIKAYEKAASLHEKYRFENFPAADYLYLPLGAHYTRLGDNEKARAIYLKALQDPSLQRATAARAGIYNNIGLTYWNDGNNAKAISWFQKGLELPGLSAEKSGLLRTALARSLAESGQTAKALQTARKALKQIQQLYQNEPESYNAYHLAGIYALFGELNGASNTRQALQHYERAIHYLKLAFPSGYHREIAKTYIRRGMLLLDQKEASKALSEFYAALQSLLPDFCAKKDALPDSSILYAENALMEALEGIADALSLAPQASESEIKQAIQAHQLADYVQDLLYQSYRYESSKLLLQAQARQRSEKSIALYYQLYSKTKNKQYLQQAFDVAERHKARLLRENLRENLLRGSMQNAELFKEKTKIQQQIAFLERQLLSQPQSQKEDYRKQLLDQLIEQRYQLDQKMMATYPRYAKILQQKIASLQEIQKQIEDERAVLSCFYGSQHLYSWLLMPSGKWEFHRLALADSSLSKALNAISRLLPQRSALARNRNAFAQLARSLYQQLYPKTLRSKLPDQILIIPDGPLYHLPFDIMLTSPPDTAASWADWPFLLFKQQIHYAYSANVWLEQNQMKSKDDKVLFIRPSFPKEDPRNLPPLSLSIHLPEGLSYDSLAGVQASTTAFRQRASHYSLLHLHTHALSEGSPRIELSDSSLFLPDIYALPLQAELVVLSACQTGSGQLIRGEGAMSLARAFSYAGARDLIASLWKVNEKSTATLFQYFYRYLSKKYTHGQALRQAKIDYLRHEKVENWEKSPYYWAAFIPIGSEPKPSGSLPPYLLPLGFGLLAAAFLFFRRRNKAQK